ncbi:hypothetical protein NUW54_g1333 [Trametes sanguinea]|uniref:Uncharacterized protein n=1 Tax=Trametes sanguinea TaxID=158606 RepID=A0ACC1Q6M4_9APHY|nr:hypothetical protein NUW54_g1333 [Trametes sanguinea]
MANTDSSEYGIWAPPVYDLTRPPREVHAYQLDAEVNSCGNATGDPSTFARMAKWLQNLEHFPKFLTADRYIRRCPDGSAALAQCEDRTFRYLQLPAELLGVTADALQPASLPRCLTQSAPILDYAWYPAASIRDSASFCFVASVRECPDGSSISAGDSFELHTESWIIANAKLRRIAWPSMLAQTGMLILLACFRRIISALAFAPDMSSGMYAAAP